jgi:hypothetical protein
MTLEVYNTWFDNKVCELSTVCLPWQHWTKSLVWIDNVDISAFHRCVVVVLLKSLYEWHLLLSACVLVRGGVRSTRGLGPAMIARDRSIGISIGMLDKLIRTTLGLKHGAPSRAGPGTVAPLATLKRRLWFWCTAARMLELAANEH